MFSQSLAAVTTVGIGQAFSAESASLFGDGFFHELSRATAHGVAQGGFAEISGGDFGSSFMAGFSGSIAGSMMSGTSQGRQMFGAAGDGSNRIVHRTVAAAVVGGTVSEIAGGKFANGAQSAAMVHLFNHENIFQKAWSGVRAAAHIHEKTNRFSISNTASALGSGKDKALVAAVIVDKTTFNGTFTEPHTITAGFTLGGSLGPGYRQEHGGFFSYDLFNLKFEVGRYQTDSILVGWEAGFGGSVGKFNTFDISGKTTSLNGSVGPAGLSIISNGHFTEGYNYTGSQFSVEFGAPYGLSGAGQKTTTTSWLSF